MYVRAANETHLVGVETNLALYLHAFDQALAVEAALDRGGRAKADQAGEGFEIGELVIGRKPWMRLGVTFGLMNLEQWFVRLLAPGVFGIDGPTAEGRLTLKTSKLITRNIQPSETLELWGMAKTSMPCARWISR